ncbi:putative dienelactone hydrolase [Paraburkholderia sp. MM5482-R1]
MMRRGCAALSSAVVVSLTAALSGAMWASLPANAIAQTASAGWHVGETSRVFHPAVARNWRGAQTQALITRIWYPADAAQPETPHDIGAPGHPMFVGHAAADDAPLSAAQPKYPLLLLSHGTGGSADSLDWLAASLAAQGYIVAGVNHPGNNALEPRTRDGFILWWERATDLSEVLDGVLADPRFGPRVDTTRIGALGFSLGGYTVLEVAGARTDRAALERFCTSPEADAICSPPEAANLAHAPGTPALTVEGLSAETNASRARSGDSYRDPRVKAAFAIAPRARRGIQQFVVQGSDDSGRAAGGRGGHDRASQHQHSPHRGLHAASDGDDGAGRLALYVHGCVRARGDGASGADLQGRAGCRSRRDSCANRGTGA